MDLVDGDVGVNCVEGVFHAFVVVDGVVDAPQKRIRDPQ